MVDETMDSRWPEGNRTGALVRVLGASAVFVVLVLAVYGIVRLAFGDVMDSGLRARVTVELSGAMAAEIILFVLLLRWLRGRGITLAELGLRRGAGAQGWVAAALVAALFIGFNVALPLRGTPNLWELSLFRVYNGLLAGLTAGVVEEVFFRGWMMTALDRAGHGRTAQVSVSALLYGAVHSAWGFTSGVFTMQLVGGAVVGTAIFGAFCSGVYLLSGRRLWPVIVAHTAIDFVIEPWLFMVALTMAPVAPQPGDDPGLYFGQRPPGATPEVFAPGIVSLDDRFEQFLVYRPDGQGLVFSVTNGDWSAFELRTMDRGKNGWGPDARAAFQGQAGGLTAALSPDGDEVFITAPWPSYPPSDVWRSRREAGRWSEPLKVGPPVSSAGDEWEVAMAANGTLYFSSDRPGGEGDLDIYRAPRVNGGYVEAENLGPKINSSAGDDLPWIAPDESYLIFASDRPGGLGNRDLYISYRVGGAWTDPVNLGAPINSPQWDIYPSVSPDGRYLFFTRRESWQPEDDSDIWWVEAGFVERLAYSERIKVTGSVFPARSAGRRHASVLTDAKTSAARR